jgi:hypothetical protein
MTSLEGLDVREVIFINARCRVDYMNLPDEVRESADQSIDALQNSLPLPAKWHRPLQGSLAGIDEIRFPHSGDTYRVTTAVGTRQNSNPTMASARRAARGLPGE